MLISVHIRKCAGTTFKSALTSYFGDKIVLDYGDEVGSSWPSSKEKRLRKLANAFQHKHVLEQKVAIIHGHFFRSKYDFIEGPKDYITFMRDPVQRVLSNYFYLKRNVDRDNPDSYVVNKLGFSLEEYASHPDSQNLQYQYLQSDDLSEFKFVGIVEQYEESLRTLNTEFNLKLPHADSKNINDNGATDYDVSNETLEVIEHYNAKDRELYNIALERLNLKEVA